MEKSYKRKILEAFLAQRVERHFSKSEILELYLNRIFFGLNFYGVQAASRGYFGKTCGTHHRGVGHDLRPHQEPEQHPAAQASAACAQGAQPRARPHGAGGHADLRRGGEAQELKPMATAPQSSDPRLSYIFDAVRTEVMNLVGEERASIGGFKIYTSIDQDLQRKTEESMQKHLKPVEQRQGYEHQTFEQYRGIISDYRARLKRGEIDPTTPKPKPEYLQGRRHCHGQQGWQHARHGRRS
jgi:membrane peptidoglycan carboxypeptidase